jgi:hypothetical protein
MITAWQCISLEVTVKGFIQCCVSSAVGGTDDMLWNVSEEDESVWSECEGDEGTDCEGGDSDSDWYQQIESDMLCVLSV